jgi:hypothetical protein
MYVMRTWYYNDDDDDDDEVAAVVFYNHRSLCLDHLMQRANPLNVLVTITTTDLFVYTISTHAHVQHLAIR